MPTGDQPPLIPEIPGLTYHDSKRIADAAVEAIQEASRRFDAMCATIEHQNYLKNNATKW